MSEFFSSIGDFFVKIKDDFVFNFIEDGRWHYVTDGLKMTLVVTIGAVIIGIIIGVIIAAIRSTYDKNEEEYRRRGGAGAVIMRILNGICKIYLTVIRGTPVVVQLLIMYLIVLVSTEEVMVGIITFGINSGAYVAEIFRSGIMSIDPGQFEAGRSLGFNYVQTMRFIIIPQAFKNVLPTLCNEFIALLKETSVMGYIALQDLTKGIYIIIGRTYSYVLPLTILALSYLIMVMILTWLVGRLERRLRASER
jgi:ABC-type amino acid transport system permease subunit